MIIRGKPNRFTIVPNDAIEDERLSWDALGVLVYLCSKPDSWVVRPGHLIAIRKAGRDKIRRILKELEAAGYLERRRIRVNGRWDWETVVRVPANLSAVGLAIDGFSVGGFPVDGFSVDGKTVDGKPVDLVNTEGTRTEEARTEGTRTESSTTSGRCRDKNAGEKVFAIYEQEIGPLTPFIVQEIEEAIQEFGPETVVAAIRVAAVHSARRWSYVRGVLERWDRRRDPWADYRRAVVDSWQQFRRNGEPVGLG